ncbi:neuronal acetylcholine receptor subunit alpha-4 isoform X2 [Hyalella azteca]|uniref:Neuronal acetylcholine receptor subunit alpha-4 isoform X2 n=1 Tax=Hyalella azteca TaxID=294128 RepID=A0A979FXB4_HYAAZ|nr:neuronal acetylcholine receptor subunit alpha-4 isoform X2 [Hyalella azteca]
MRAAFCFIFVAIVHSVVVEGSNEEIVRKQLMENYDKYSLPNQLTNVTARFTILDIDVDSKENAMILDAWIAMEWADPRLTWDVAQFPDVDRIAFRPDDVWRPDLKLYNRALLRGTQTNEECLVLAFPDGKILHVPQVTLPVACELDMTYWPVDVHNCSAKIGSWVYSGLRIDLRPKDDQPKFEITTRTKEGNFVSRQSWEVLDSTVARHAKKYPCCPEDYVDLTLSLIIRRDAPSLAWTIKTVALVLTVATGLMPPLLILSHARLVAGLLLFILQLQFITYIGSLAHKSPASSPLVLDLMNGQFALTLLFLIQTAFMLRMIRAPHGTRLPAPLRRLSSMLSYILCLPGYRKLSVESSYPGSFPKSVKGEEVSMTADHPDAVPADGKHADWMLFAAVLDRAFMLIYIAVFVFKAANFCHMF